MHPVLQEAVSPIVQQLASSDEKDLQISPRPGAGRWCGQMIVEHLLLSFEATVRELEYRLNLASGKTARNHLSPSRTPLQWALKLHVISLGRFPTGVPTLPHLEPQQYYQQPGEQLSARLISSAEEMDAVLTLCRERFGVEVCGDHPIFGPLRVDEWRRYHALHLRHHGQQLHHALAYARTHAEDPAARPSSVHPGLTPGLI